MLSSVSRVNNQSGFDRFVVSLQVTDCTYLGQRQKDNELHNLNKVLTLNRQMIVRLAPVAQLYRYKVVCHHFGVLVSTNKHVLLLQ